MTYKLKWYIQCLLWLFGHSKHFNDECTVDFSCCYPELGHSFTYRANILIGRILKGYWTRYIK